MGQERAEKGKSRSYEDSPSRTAHTPMTNVQARDVQRIPKRVIPQFAERG